MTVRTLLQMIGAFFRSLLRKSTGRPDYEFCPECGAMQDCRPDCSLRVDGVVEKSVPAAPRPKPISARMRRRIALRRMLKRTDGGGKHYGSKRAGNNHRGGGHGKRSGHQ